MDEQASINTPEASSGTASCWQSLNLRAAFLPKGRRKHTHISSAADKVSHLSGSVNPDPQTDAFLTASKKTLLLQQTLNRPRRAAMLPNSRLTASQIFVCECQRQRVCTWMSRFHGCLAFTSAVVLPCNGGSALLQRTA